MKLCRFYWVGIYLFFACNAFSQATVAFRNNAATGITNCANNLPPEPKTIKIGLYFTTDLSAVSNTAAQASMTLIAVTTNAPLAGLGWFFNGGTVRFPDMEILTTIVLQTKAWPIAYPTFEAAVDAGADVAESLPWVQRTGGSINPPTILANWGFRPFLFPQCGPHKVPMFVERVNGKLRVCWPIGLPPTVQMNDGLSTNWVSLTSGTFVTDHWELDIPTTGGAQFFRLAQ
jgi:hypothetical protein